MNSLGRFLHLHGSAFRAEEINPGLLADGWALVLLFSVDPEKGNESVGVRKPGPGRKSVDLVTVGARWIESLFETPHLTTKSQKPHSMKK